MNNKKLQVGILGATGVAGLEFIKSLQNHPWFEIKELYASAERSAGKPFYEACHLDTSYVTDRVNNLIVGDNNHVGHNLDLICSALPSEIAKELEGKCAKHTPVISTTSAYRYEDDVPILITEINSDHVNILNEQKARGWNGWIAPGPNCTTVGLAMSLAPLYHSLGIKRVIMSSYQAVSGGGYPLIQKWKGQKSSELPEPKSLDLVIENPEMQIEGNVIGYIPKEEVKVNHEIKKILGKFLPLHRNQKSIYPAEFDIDCFCVRVPTLEGHFETVFVETDKDCSPEALNDIYMKFNCEARAIYGALPSSPKNFITVIDRAPQPYFDANLDNGMTAVVGRIDKNDAFGKGIKFQVVSNNLERGAAKGIVHVAEYLHSIGFLDGK